jgi:hypothetical protein
MDAPCGGFISTVIKFFSRHKTSQNFSNMVLL